jgi:hypothetical protein
MEEKSKFVKKPKESQKKTSDGEFIFESTEDLEVYTTFDDMGLREDLIKGKII